MKSSGEAERPGYAHGTAHRSGIGQFGAGNQPQHRRFAGAINAEEAIRPSAVEYGRDMIQNNFSMPLGPVELEDVVELDHVFEDNQIVSG